MAVGNLEFIKSASGTSVTTLSVTDCFSDKYDNYAIIMGKSDTNTDGGFFRMRLLDSGGSVISAAEYDNSGLRLRSTASFLESKGTNDTFWTGLSSSTGAATVEGGTAITYIFNPYDSSSYTFSLTQSVNMNGSNELQGFKYSGVHTSAEQITGFQVLSSPSVTFETLELSVYGVK